MRKRTIAIMVLVFSGHLFAGSLEPLKISDKCTKLYYEYADYKGQTGQLYMMSRFLIDPYATILTGKSSNLSDKVMQEAEKKRVDVDAILKKSGCPSLKNVEDWYNDVCPKIWPAYNDYVTQLSTLDGSIDSVRIQIQKNEDLKDESLTPIIKEKETELNKKLKEKQELENKLEKLKRDFKFNEVIALKEEIVKQVVAIADLIYECRKIVGGNAEGTLNYTNGIIREKELVGFYDKCNEEMSPVERESSSRIKCGEYSSIVSIDNKWLQERALAGGVTRALKKVIKADRWGYKCFKTEEKEEAKVMCEDDNGGKVFIIRATKSDLENLEKISLEDFFSNRGVCSPSPVNLCAERYNNKLKEYNDKVAVDRTPSKEEISTLVKDRDTLKAYYNTLEKLITRYNYFINDSVFGSCVLPKIENSKEYTLNEFLKTNQESFKRSKKTRKEDATNETIAEVGFNYAFASKDSDEGYSGDKSKMEVNKDLSYCEIK